MTEIPTLTLGDRLRRSRKDAGLTPEQMGDLLLCGRNAVGAWENDRRKPSVRKLHRWAQIVAERTSYPLDAVLLFIGLAPVTDLAERRRSERRAAARQAGQQDMWIFATRTVGNETLRILPAA